jgi:hypothetical protein
MRRLTRVLARYGPADCRSIFPSVETILGKLRLAELNYPECGAPWVRRMSWSKRTVQVYLKRLHDSGISENGGRTGYHGTRLRVLRPEKLLSAPLESCTSTPRESCTRSKSLDSKKLQVRESHPAPQSRRDDSPSRTVFRPKREPVTYEQRMRSFIRHAIPLLASTGLDGHSSQSRIWQVIINAEKSGKIIRSAQYLVAGVMNQLEEEEKKRGLMKREISAGSGPSDDLPPPRYCAKCGHTFSWHLRAKKHPEREPHFDEHEFVSEVRL